MRNPKRTEEDGDIDELDPRNIIPQAYHSYESIRTQRITDFYFTNHIKDPHFYIDMVHKIKVAQPQDIIYIHFNTPGGRLDTGIQIINAIRDSQARIVGVLDSKAFSLGTLIFLACDEYVVHDNCQFMIHNFSSGTIGKGNEQEWELLATLSWFKKLCRKYYYPFLSQDEIERMLKGQDFWFESDEVKKRLKAMVAQQLADMQPKARKTKTKNTLEAVAVDGKLPAANVIPADDSSASAVKAA